MTEPIRFPRQPLNEGDWIISTTFLKAVSLALRTVTDVSWEDIENVLLAVEAWSISNNPGGQP
jgi:hypothetical protein